MEAIDESWFRENYYLTGLRTAQINRRIRDIVRKAASRVLTNSPRCRCDFLPDLITEQVITEVLVADYKGLADYDDALIDAAFTKRRWPAALRKNRRARAEVEVAVGRTVVQRGRPRHVFLTELDRQTAGSIMDHVREVGLGHLRDRLQERMVIQWSPEDENTVHTPFPWPALLDSRIQEAMQVLEASARLNDAQYRNRRNGLVNQMLAALAECSVERTRKLLTDPLAEPIREPERAVPRAARKTVERGQARDRERKRVEEQRERADPTDTSLEAAARASARMESTAEELLERFKTI